MKGTARLAGIWSKLLKSRHFQGHFEENLFPCHENSSEMRLTPALLLACLLLGQAAVAKPRAPGSDADLLPGS